MPKSFTRNDGMGDVLWSKNKGEYSYTLQYGMMADRKMESNLNDFIKAYRS